MIRGEAFGRRAMFLGGEGMMPKERREGRIRETQ
jgi:hypothetical protein